MDNWKLLYKYKGLVRVGQAREFICPQCDNKLTFMKDQYDEPVMYCPYDDEGYIPGSDFWSDIRAVVSEFDLEV